MKTPEIVLFTTALFVILEAHSPLSAAVVNGEDGVNLGGTGLVIGAPIIDIFSVSGLTDSWLQPIDGYANMIAPVGQFTGFNDWGGPIPYLDLVPLRTSRITVVDSASNTIFSAGPNGIDFGSIMSVDSNNVLSLFKSDGTTSGISFNPNTGEISLSGTASGIYAGGTPVFNLGTTGDLDFGSRPVKINNATAPLGSTTGALTVSGGIGVAKDSYFNGVRIGRGNANVSSNTAVGYDALRSTSGSSYNYNSSAFGAYTLYYNSGNNNVAFGYSSLFGNTSGSSNSAVGSMSLAVNNTGSNNSAAGHASLRSNTTGQSNTAMGSRSLYNNTTGGSNVAIGSDAGYYAGAGTNSLTAAQNSIYIGANSRGFSNADQNSIVIGASAVGEGNNTTVIGTSATTKTHLHGTTQTGGLVVDGQTLLKGQVILESAQGDISMGIYGTP